MQDLLPASFNAIASARASLLSHTEDAAFVALLGAAYLLIGFALHLTHCLQKLAQATTLADAEHHAATVDSDLPATRSNTRDTAPAQPMLASQQPVDPGKDLRLEELNFGGKLNSWYDRFGIA